MSDLTKLSAVGHAVAVNPDAMLKKYALAAGWEIMKQHRSEID